MQEAAVIELSQEKQGPRWKRRKDARPQELINAALSLFGEFGYSQTRLDDVAAKAGISKGTVYLYFSSKQDLFEAVIRERAAPWIEVIRNRKDDVSQSTEVVLREFLYWGWQQFLDSKLYLIARIVLAESNNFPHLAETYLREVMGPVHEQLTALLTRGIERGEVQGEVSRERIKVLLAPLSWLALWRQALQNHSISPIDEQAYIREAIDMAVRSVILHNPGTPLRTA
jgi:AcrR family transcriptional regulator